MARRPGGSPGARNQLRRRIRLLRWPLVAAAVSAVATSGVAQVVALVDHSLSMAGRLQVAGATLGRLERELTTAGLDIVFVGVGRGVISEGASLQGVLRRGPAGTSPLYAAMEHASGMRRVDTIVVASDGLDGEQPGHLGRIPPQIASRAQHLVLMQFALPENQPLQRALREAVVAAGGRVVAASDAAGLIEAVLDGDALRAPTAAQSGPPDEVAGAAGDGRRAVLTDVAAPRTPLGLQEVLLAYGIAMLAVLVVLVVRAALVRAENAQALTALPPPTAVVDLRITRAADRRGADAVTESLESLPARIGPGLGGRKRVQSFTLERSDGGVWIRSRAGHLVNGVLTRRRALKEGDVVAVGGYRVQYGGERLVAPPVPDPRRLRPLAEGIAAALLTVLGAAGVIVALLPPEPEPAAVAAPPPPEIASSTRASADAAALPPLPPPPPVTPRVPLLDSALVAPALVDLLLVHAHPDDETLDFGILIARAVDAGLRVATVLMTDGEAGLDRYPARGTPAGYPAREVRGLELAELRVQEAARALAVLGSDTLIRLALPNAPYFRGFHAREPEDVVRDWGDDRVVGRLATIIEKLRPRAVVAPAGPLPVLEHFEHEATGLLVRRAVQRVRATGVLPDVALFTSRDPRQLDPQPDWQRVDGTVVATGSELTYRQLQLLALQQYHTQSDATVFGVEQLAAFGREYYVLAVPGKDSSVASLLSVATDGDQR